MAAPASNSNTSSIHSPRQFKDSLSSPTTQSPRAAKGKSSPWSQIVRGESEPMVAVTSSPQSTAVISDQPAVAVAAATSDPAATVSLVAPAPASAQAEAGLGNGGGPNGNAGKRSAWNRPSNVAIEVGPVMGAHSWPGLLESTRTLSVKSSSDSLRGLPDKSSPISVSQVTGTASSSTQKQLNSNASTNSSPNHTIPARHRSVKRNGATPFNSSIPQPTSPHGPIAEVPLNTPSPRDQGHRTGSQSHSGNDNSQQRNTFRNRNGGSHPRGDGNHHNNYGGRRNQEHGNHDWNTHRNFNGRDAHMPQRAVPRFIRHPAPPPPPNSVPFIAQLPVRPFPNPMGFHEMPPPLYYVPAPPPPPESLRSVPFVAPLSPHPMFYRPPLNNLHSQIVRQVDYYFSNPNLVKDIYLRKNMDQQGWVPIDLIAGFKQVKMLTRDIPVILEALRNSFVVEVQGEKVRRRNDGEEWAISATPDNEMQADPNQNVSVEQTTTSLGGVSDQVYVNTQTHPSGSQENGEATAHGVSDNSTGKTSSH